MASFKDLVINGIARIVGKVYSAGGFVGNLEGTASKATADADGNTISSTYVKTTDTRLTDSRTPKSHAHGNITNDGLVGTAANKPLITTTGGKVTTGSFGTSANTFAEGNHNHDSAYAKKQMS